MALPNTNITPGSPPLLWSDLHSAFQQINENFDSVAAALGVAGLTPIDFETLDTSVSPTDTVTYNLGSNLKRWKAVYTGEWQNISGQENNGVWLGSAQIKGILGIVDLPAGSTVDGDLIIDPTKKAFSNILVTGQDTITANSATSEVTFAPGTAITLTTNGLTDTLTITNAGVTGLTAGSGIGVSASTGNITVTNNGVRTATAGAAIVGRASGLGISVSGTNDISITNTGVVSITQGAGISVSSDDTTGVYTISNTAANVFKNIAVDGQSTIIADSPSDTLTVAGGYGIIVTTNDSTDTITFTLDQKHIDISASVFADDSTLLVDGVAGRIVGPVFSNVTGNLTGNVTGNVLGNVTGIVTGGLIGDSVGYHTGDVTGSVFADDSTLLVDGVSGIVVADIENALISTQILTVGQIDPDPISGEIYLNGTVYGDLNGVVYGTTVGGVEGDVYDVDGDLLLDGTARSLIGDVVGSVFADDSSTMVDAVDNRLSSNTLEVTSYIQFPTYANAAARDLAITAPLQGMVILIIDNGSAVTKLQAYVSSSWIDL